MKDDSAISTFRWLGRDEMHLDAPSTMRCRDVVVGCYGGNRKAGAHKNEDGALVWCADDGAWEFAVLLDAHYSADSAELVLEAIEDERKSIVVCMQQPVGTAFASLHWHLLDLFRSEEFRAKCRGVHGEASCLICARKGQFLWWLSVGDCVVYLFHEDLAELGQFALNQRSYYEWIGERNTFDLPVACYSTGVRELPYGPGIIAMTTDGLLECGSRPFENPKLLYQVFAQVGPKVETAVRSALARVHKERGRDSATVIAWLRGS